MRKHWDESIERVLRSDLELHDFLHRSLADAFDAPDTPVPLSFRECLRDTFQSVMNDATIEMLGEHDRGRLAAHVLYRCLCHPRVEKPGNAAAVLREIRESFPDEGREFRQALANEYVGEYSRR